MHHLLVTFDFPPKTGGIQSYLHELWRRLPPSETTVLTRAHPGAESWDLEQSFRIERVRAPLLFPSPSLVGRINALADEVGADLVLLDPVWPLGIVGPRLDRPFGVVLHGAEVTIPAQLPFVQLLIRQTLRGARLVIAAGGYPAAIGRAAAGRELPVKVIAPGVDIDRFQPLTIGERAKARAEFGIEADAHVVLGLSRLVRRKGFDVLVQAAARVAEDDPQLQVLIAGEGRDRARLEALAQSTAAPVRFLGAVDDDRLAALYGCSDVFAMLCRNRWLGLEQEGFGIVFLEAAAAGVPSIAGLSGGSAEAVVDGVTGLVLSEPSSVDDLEEALRSLFDDHERRLRLGRAARVRAENTFGYDGLARSLHEAIRSAVAEALADAAAVPAPVMDHAAADPVPARPAEMSDD